MDIHALVEAQHKYYQSGATRPVEFRIEALRKLQRAIRANEKLLADALKQDLNKSETESYMCETGMVLEELSYHIKHVAKWTKNRRVKTPLAQFSAKSYISPEPYGVALIVSPWNYPPEYIAAVEGGRAENQALFEEKFDYIFFTGSVEVGKTVMQAAAKHLTPVTLELGGKSPAIVDERADIKLAARRIAFGKVLNAGQTCVEPDYLLIHRSIKEAFVSEYQDALEQFFPNGDMRDMVNIISEKHYNRVKGLIQGESIALGGTFDDERRFIAPTLLDDVSPDAPIMQQEIFGPVLPMLCFDTLSEVISFVNSRPKPLAFYLFTADKAAERRLLDSCSFGGGCVNDTIIHLASSALPFGGVGESGMGSYHGKKSFDTFTHERSVVHKSTKIDLPMRYFPYSKKKLRIIKMFMK